MSRAPERGDRSTCAGFGRAANGLWVGVHAGLEAPPRVRCPGGGGWCRYHGLVQAGEVGDHLVDAAEREHAQHHGTGGGGQPPTAALRPGAGGGRAPGAPPRPNAGKKGGGVQPPQSPAAVYLALTRGCNRTRALVADRYDGPLWAPSGHADAVGVAHGARGPVIPPSHVVAAGSLSPRGTTRSRVNISTACCPTTAPA